MDVVNSVEFPRFGKIIHVAQCPGDHYKLRNEILPAQKAIEDVIAAYPGPKRVAFNLPDSYILTDEDAKPGLRMTDDMRNTDLCTTYDALIQPDPFKTRLKRALSGQNTNNFLSQVLGCNPPTWWEKLKAKLKGAP